MLETAVRTGIPSPWWGASGRGYSSEPYQFRRHICDLGVRGRPLHEPEHVSQDLVSVLPVGADAGDSQLSQLPAVPLADLRRRHLELLPHPPQQPADDLPLGLEGTGIRQMKG